MKRSWMWRVCRAVKFWWQRRARGWDDSDLWNLDQSLAKLIAPRLRAFAANAHAYPGDLSFEQWKADLQTMLAAFEVIASDAYWEPRSAEADAEIQRGLDLFAKHFQGLWD